jgi:hypothetical protein
MGHNKLKINEILLFSQHADCGAAGPGPAFQLRDARFTVWLIGSCASSFSECYR